MQTAADKRHFALRKLHSLTGLLPIGGYLFFHLFENSMVRFRGAEGFNEQAKWIGELPLLQVVEAILLGSILFHGFYGLVITMDMKVNVTRYPKARNWMYVLQRVTGLIAFAFIGWHFYQTRWQYYAGEFGFQAPVEVSAAWMRDNIWGHGWAVAAYLVGVVSSVFHLTNGIWNMLISWGVTVGPTAQRVSAWACNSVFVVVSAFGVWVVFGFRNV